MTRDERDRDRVTHTLLFSPTPDCLQGPLSILFGGNPFEEAKKTNSDRSVSSFSTKLSSILSIDISSLLAPILQGLQRALRARLMELVGGGHRLLESKIWNHVQQAVVSKVSKYVKGVEVSIGESLEEKKSRHQRENEQIKLDGLQNWDWEKGGKSEGVVKDEEKEKVQQSLNEISGEAASFYDGSHHSVNINSGISSTQSEQQRTPIGHDHQRNQGQESGSYSFPTPDHHRSNPEASNSKFSMPQPSHYQN